MEYKLIIYGKGLYKEVPLKEEFAQKVSIGTGKESQLRFQSGKYGLEFQVSFEKSADKWCMTCSDTIYLKKDNLFKEFVQYPNPGDVIMICDSETDAELFSIHFSIDFGNDCCDYNKRIDCRNVNSLQIGGLVQSTVRILQDSIAQDEIRLEKQQNGGYLIYLEQCRYGISINGCQIKTGPVPVQNHDFFSINGCHFYINDEWLYTSENMPLDTRLYVEAVQSVKNHYQYPKFIRSVRQLYVTPEEKLEVLAPKQLPEEPQGSLAMTIVPILSSLILTVVMRGLMGRSGVFMIYCVGTMVLSAAMSLWNYKNQGKQYKERCKKREEDYLNYVAAQEVKIQELRQKEQMIARQQNTVLEEQLDFVADFDSRLFEKQKEDEDFLDCFLGRGTLEAACQVDYKKQEYVDTEDPLMDYPQMLHEKYRYIDDMPITMKLKEMNAVGFVGDRGKLYQIAKNMLLSLSATHYFKDVKYFFILNEEDKDYFDWARWLKNAVDEKAGIRNFMYDNDSRKVLLEFLYNELSRRESAGAKNRLKDEPYFVVFVYRSEYISTHPISNYIEKAKELGFLFLFFEDYAEFVHKDCNARVFLERGSNEGDIQYVENGEEVQRFCYPHITKERAAFTALRLGCIYVDEVSLESTLTKNISLFRLMNIQTVEDLNLETRWNNSKIYETMAAPLGVKSGDEIVYLDLHEKFHGPHGLVAGTTGSGKSEILQSYILSMATLFHPYEVGFVIIDFKGGGMVNQFRDLPHLNGAITNIDGREIDRSLSSIRAELRKRQELFSEYGVNHIDDYIKLFKEHKTEKPLPHLILIVDEFAELKSEQPEFMKELISTARIGRSLGVHLILATQKPSGVVNDQIWSNSKFKLCLKVQTKEDSNEVLKSPLAAEIREPGRAYLQVGNNEIFQLFQSAYSGETIPSQSVGAVKKFRVCKVDLAGRRTVIYEQKPQKDESGVTQLDALVSYVHNYCEEKHIAKLPDICLPALGFSLPYTQEGYEAETTDICVPVGFYDNPSRQMQAVTDVNFTQNHIYVVGSSQYGKTNLLQTMIRGLSDRYTSDEVNIYVLDFATMIMKNFETLRHVGAVMTPREDEKIKNFIKMMMEEIEKRKDTFAQMGLSSFGAYRESGYREMPQIIIMLDNFGAFKELFPKYEEYLLSICREGVAVGVSLVATTSQTSAVGYRYLSNFGKRIALYCNESSEYNNIFEKCRIKPDNKPGRCLLELDREVYEGQVYLAFPAEKEIEKIAEIRTYIEQTNQADTGKGAKKVPEIPNVVTQEFIKRQLTVSLKPYQLPAGLNFATTEFEFLNLNVENVIGISGKEHMGANNFLNYIVGSLIRNKEQDAVRFYVIDSLEKKLKKQFTGMEQQVQYSCNPMDSIAYMAELKKELSERYQWMMDGQEERLEQEPLLVYVINAADAYTVLSNSAETMEEFKEIINRFRALKLCFLFAQLPNAGMSYGSLPFIKSMKELISVYLFYNLSEQKVADVTPNLVREYAKPLEAGEAYHVYGALFQKLKTPLWDN